MSFYWFDIVGAVIILAFAAISWIRGFVKEAFSALAWLGGYFVAIHFYPELSAVYVRYLKFALVANFLAFLTIFIGVYLAVSLVSYLVREKLGLKNVPKIIDGPAGGLMGACKGVLFMAVLLLPLAFIPSWRKELLERSYIARWTYQLSGTALPLAGVPAERPAEKIKERIQTNIDTLKRNLPPEENIVKEKPPERHTEAARREEPEQRATGIEKGETRDKIRPPVKKVEPVVKRQPEGEEERERMDSFMKGLH